MYKAALALLVGLMLSVSGSAWGATKTAIKGPECRAIEQRVEIAISGGLSICGLKTPSDCYDYEITEDYSRFLRYRGNNLEEYRVTLVENALDAASYQFYKMQQWYKHLQKTEKIGSLVAFFTDTNSNTPFGGAEDLCQTFKSYRYGTGKSSTVPSEISNLWDNIPDWCSNLPISRGKIFACGIGDSANKFVAKDLAHLDGKQQLVDLIAASNSEASHCNSLNNRARVRNRVTLMEDPDGETTVTELVSKANLIEEKHLNFESQRIGERFVHFVLVEYSIQPEDDLLAEKLKQEDELCLAANKALAAKALAAKALAELEAQIDSHKKLQQ